MKEGVILPQDGFTEEKYCDNSITRFLDPPYRILTYNALNKLKFIYETDLNIL